VDGTLEIFPTFVRRGGSAFGLPAGFLPQPGAGAWLRCPCAKKRVGGGQPAGFSALSQGICVKRLSRIANVDEPFSRTRGHCVNGMLNEMETMIHALSGVGNDIAHELRTAA